MPEYVVEAKMIGTESLLQRVQDRAAEHYGAVLLPAAVAIVMQALADELRRSAGVAERLEHPSLALALGAFGEILDRAAVQR